MAESVAVVGAGIVGLAHAWREAAHGARVTLFERSARAQGASVRNFGMIWPIGQSQTYIDTAIHSRELWDEFVRETGVWHSPCGSLFVAKHADEWQVLSEFANHCSDWPYQAELMSSDQVRSTCSAVNSDGLLGGLLSHTEMGVDPREVIAKAPQWLADRFEVSLEFNTTVSQVDLPVVQATDGRSWNFDRVTVASGADFATLYPEVISANQLDKCKLQMMRTVSQPADWKLGPHVAGGLTLRHYASFANCEGLANLRARVAAETPELDRYGIHVMAAHNGRGELVLGDSHQYGGDISPFDSEEISTLILRELRKFVDFPDWTLAERWHGIYPIQPSSESIQFVHETGRWRNHCYCYGRLRDDHVIWNGRPHDSRT